LGAFVVAGVDVPVCPFGLEGPVEAFDLADLPGAVGLDRHMTGADGGESRGERAASGVRPVVVGHDIVDVVDTVCGEEASGAQQELGGGVAGLVGEDL